LHRFLLKNNTSFAMQRLKAAAASSLKTHLGCYDVIADSNWLLTHLGWVPLEIQSG
jgi:hypothetical protein